MKQPFSEKMLVLGIFSVLALIDYLRNGIDGTGIVVMIAGMSFFMDEIVKYSFIIRREEPNTKKLLSEVRQFDALAIALIAYMALS